MNRLPARPPMAKRKHPEKPGDIRIVVTCEHASNAVPAKLRQRLAIPPSLLNTHRAWDPGTLELARAIAKATKSYPVIAGKMTRLVVDLNRSPDNPDVFSKWSMTKLSPAERDLLIKKFHQPFWQQTRKRIEDICGHGKHHIFHVSVHSFTPVLRGQRRTVDIGILFDPARPRESELSQQWIQVLQKRAMTDGLRGIRICANEPYLGISDAHTTALRRKLNPNWYSGVEVEVNQKIVRQKNRRWDSIIRLICESLVTLLETQGANLSENSKAAPGTRPVRRRITRRVSSRRAQGRR
ncbi:MAG: hypothetical protein RIQ81_1157 [Pseudomonadota bacterium]